MKTILKQIQEILQEAITINLPKDDISSCLEYLENKEYGLCFDTIVTQLYEHDLKISNEFYDNIQMVGIKLGINEDEFDYLKENII